MNTPAARFGSQYRLSLKERPNPLPPHQAAEALTQATLGLVGGSNRFYWGCDNAPELYGNFDASKAMAALYRDHSDIFCLDSHDAELEAKLESLFVPQKAPSRKRGQAHLPAPKPKITPKSLETMVEMKKVEDCEWGPQPDVLTLKDTFYRHLWKTGFRLFNRTGLWTKSNLGATNSWTIGIELPPKDKGTIPVT